MTLPVVSLRPAHVLGRGAVSVFGLGAPKLVKSVFAGRSGIVRRSRTRDWDVPTSVAGEFPPDVVDALGGEGDLAFSSALAAAHAPLPRAAVAQPA